MSVKIISLNIGGYTDWESRKVNIAEYLNNENASILLLQEVRYNEINFAVNQAEELNGLLSVPYQFISSSVSRFYRPSVGEPYKEGLAVLSRKQIENSEVFALTQMHDDKHLRLVQNVDIKDDGALVRISNVHFSNNQYAPEQLRELLTILKKRGEKRIIAGDFNIANLSVYSELYKGYSTSYEYEKYVSFSSKGLTIDYALLPKSHEFIGLKATVGLSDHAAICYDVRLDA